MRINENTIITGYSVILMPYRRDHVPKYNDWMQSEELRKLTASDRLNLKEEYEMQKSWLEDEDKCTFIILDRKKFDETGDEVEAMIGDTNLFLQRDEGCAEIEIMIAEEWARNQGRGREATQHMLRYGFTYLGIKEFIAKIGFDNVASENMFRKLFFCETSRSDVFKESTFLKVVDENWIKRIESDTHQWKISVNSGLSFE